MEDRTSHCSSSSCRRSGLGIERGFSKSGERCFCGLSWVERTSWTDDNPGRRFITCPKMRVSICLDFCFVFYCKRFSKGIRFLCVNCFLNFQAEGGCKFFKWIDPEMCNRSKNIIPGLLRRIRELEHEVKMQGRVGYCGKCSVREEVGQFGNCIRIVLGCLLVIVIAWSWGSTCRWKYCGICNWHHVVVLGYVVTAFLV